MDKLTRAYIDAVQISDVATLSDTSNTNEGTKQPNIKAVKSVRARLASFWESRIPLEKFRVSGISIKSFQY